MAVIYKDITDTINKSKWEVVMDDERSLHVPHYYKKYPERRALYTPMTAMATSMISIHEMIEYASSNVVFGIKHRKDVIMVVDLLESYLTALLPRIASLPKHNKYVIYADKAKILHTLLEDTSDNVKKRQVDDSGFIPIKQISDLVQFM